MSASKQSISAPTLFAFIKNNNVIILDVRSKDEFERGHIFGAKCISVDELPQRHSELPSNKLIVTYCGKGGGRSESAAGLLNDQGKEALWLEGGYLEWPFASLMTSLADQDGMIFYQMFEKESSSYTYLLADPVTREALVIDPVLETVERDLKLISDLDLKILYVLETHIHADHVTGSNEIKKRTGAQSGISKKSGVCCANLELIDNQEIKFGRYTLKVLETPGHTSESLSFYCNGMVFTGDSLLIRGAGRTDFQNGSSEDLYESVQKKLFSLPNDTKVYPAHDYNGQFYSTIGLEKKLNPRLGGGKTKTEFVEIMRNLKLSDPKKMHIAVPANLKCGIVEETR